MFFSKLMPHDGNFFNLLNEHAKHTSLAADAFFNFIQNYSDEALRLKHSHQVHKAEHEADDVLKEVHRRLHKTFITPIDRDQIFALINTMDDVADLLENTTEATDLYNVKNMTPEMLQMARLCTLCCSHMSNAISALNKIGDPEVAKEILKTCDEIDQLESQADKLLSTSMARLFREDIDAKELMKAKIIYEFLEEVTDRCEDVANLIEGIVLENS
jgi:predicted phosphate transport protein (TIGR00153 family)